MDATPSARPATGETPYLRRLRRYGLLLLVLATFLPYHGCDAEPGDFRNGGGTGKIFSFGTGGVPPAAFMEWVVREKVLDAPVPDEYLWFQAEGSSNDRPGLSVYFAVPLWVLCLAAAALGRRARLAAGLLAWIGVGASLVAIGWGVIEGDLDALGPEWMGKPEAAALLLLALLLAAARPRHRWRPSDVEGTVSGHALLAVGTALFMPAYCYLGWTINDGETWGAVVATLWVNYKVGFWLGLGGLCLVAAPLYFSGPRGTPLYHRVFPWPSPSSTPTPTSTSTGSTTTGTPSSTGPGPPGSSPS